MLPRRCTASAGRRTRCIPIRVPPCAKPPALSERDQVFHDNFVEAGLHPYRAHVGYQYVPNCYECSDICPLHCKSDAGVVCVMPAMAAFGANMLEECEVVELTAEGSRVTGVRARWQGREITVRGKIVAPQCRRIHEPRNPLEFPIARLAGWAGEPIGNWSVGT